MWNRSAQYHEWLLPYLEGGLDEARRAQLEGRLSEDPVLAAEAERLRRTLAGLRGAAARTPRPENAQVPADLWPHLRARLVLDPAPRPRTSRAWWVAGLGAPAAAALIVAAFWLPGWHTPDMPQLPPKPTAHRKAAPASPTPSAGVGSPSAGIVGPATKPLPPVKKADVPKPAPPMAVVNGASPFDLPVPAPPMNRSADGSHTPPVVPAPSGRPVVEAVRPPVSPARTVAAPITHRSAAADGHVAASASVPPTPALMAPLPSPAPPPPGHTAATDQAAPLPTRTPDKVVATAGMSGGTAGPGTAAAPKETVDGLGSAAQQQDKPQPNAAPSLPSASLFGHAGQSALGSRRNKTAPRRAAPAAPDRMLRAFGADPQGDLDSWQADLAAAVRPPLWGEDEGSAQANQALMAARESGMLDDLRARLEARRTQSPRDVVTGRMLAAVYDFGFSKEAALRERRHIAGLEGATGEDWYALGQAEGLAGNGSAARAAYRRALESSIPPSPFHAAIARGRS